MSSFSAPATVTGQVLAVTPFADHAAGDFPSCISRRLRVEVIRITVDHHGFSDNILHRKPICSNSQICIPPASHQRRQVTRMVWMALFLRIVMISCSGKISPGTGIPLMNMESEESCFTSPGQSANPRHNQHASALLIKLNAPGQLRCFHPSPNPCHRIRTFFATPHKITSYQYIPATVFCDAFSTRGCTIIEQDIVRTVLRKTKIHYLHICSKTS